MRILVAATEVRSCHWLWSKSFKAAAHNTPFSSTGIAYFTAERGISCVRMPGARLHTLGIFSLCSASIDTRRYRYSFVFPMSFCHDLLQSGEKVSARGRVSASVNCGRRRSAPVQQPLHQPSALCSFQTGLTEATVAALTCISALLLYNLHH